MSISALVEFNSFKVSFLIKARAMMKLMHRENNITVL